MGHHILVFEGDDAFGKEVSSGFSKLGATVEVVNDGPKGIELAEQARPDLILLTIELPGMNGFLVCKRIKKHAELKDIPLLILSSEATEETFEQHRKLRTHADDYIRKPIAFTDLLTRVKGYVDFGANGASADDVGDDDVFVVDEDSIAPPPANDADDFAEEAVLSLTPDDVEEAPSSELSLKAPPVPGVMVAFRHR